MTFTFIDCFSGIGGFRLPLEELGGRCLGYSEINKPAIAVYQDNFDCNSLPCWDMTDLNPPLLKNADMLTGGVPCQPWSMAGKNSGFNDPRGKLWFSTVRVLRQLKPKTFILENVKGFHDDRHYNSFIRVVNLITQANYWVEAFIMNSHNFGLPQGRIRLYIVGVRRDIAPNLSKILPFDFEYKDRDKRSKLSLLDVVSGYLDKKPDPSKSYYDGGFLLTDLRNGDNCVHSWEILGLDERKQAICTTLMRKRRDKRLVGKDGGFVPFWALNKLFTPPLEEQELQELIDLNIIKRKDDKYEFVNSSNRMGFNGVYKVLSPHAECVPTITATNNRTFFSTKLIEDDGHENLKKTFLTDVYSTQSFRPFSARDIQLIQGFPESFRRHENDREASKQFGNAVSPPVIKCIAHHLLEILKNHELQS